MCRVCWWCVVCVGVGVHINQSKRHHTYNKFLLWCLYQPNGYCVCPHTPRTPTHPHTCTHTHTHIDHTPTFRGDASELIKRLTAARNGTPMPRRRAGGLHSALSDDGDLAAFVQGAFGDGAEARRRGGAGRVGEDGGEDESDVLHFD